MTDALNSMPHGITMWDKDDTLVFANTFAREIQGGAGVKFDIGERYEDCLLYTSPSPRDCDRSRMPSSA